jgi:hypothetical protein
MTGYFATGHPWEALFENCESEFLQMAVLVLLTTWLVQKGHRNRDDQGQRNLWTPIPRLSHDPEARWPVRRGGWILARSAKGR